MRKLIAFASALLMGGLLSTAAFADSGTCPAGTRLQLIGSIQTSTNQKTTQQISSGGHYVRMIVLQCGGTACQIGLANTATIAAAGVGDYVIEPGAAANTTLVLDFTGTSGLQFGSGISYGDPDTNMNSIAAYECR